MQIKQALQNTTRQYLTGQLQKAQELEHIDDEKIEIGITSYKTFYSEPPHTHTQAYEYQYMISGFTKYIDIETEEEIIFRKGDFYVITPGTQYAQKSKPGTTIIFIKIPPGNDKIAITPNNKIANWLETKIETVRTDYANDKEAPKPNAIKPAVAVALFDQNDRLLVLKRKDSGNWTMPGGTLEFGENLLQCGIREVKEETGYDIDIVDIIGTYSDAKTVVAYSDGEVRQEFTILYEGKIIGGAVSLDHESTDYKWIKPDTFLSLPLAASQKKRIQDVIDYKRSGRRSLR